VPAGAVFCATCGTDVMKALAAAASATAAMGAHEVPTAQYKSGGGNAPPRDETSAGAMLTQSRIMQALRDATLGDYEILAELGRGGMATVYLAHDIALDRKVAIKVMSPALLDGEGAIERFKREARTAGALSHPHIIPIHAVKQSGDLLYFVMKYVQGRPLDDVVRDQGALPIPMVVQILTEVAGALAYAHRKGVVHRDVKPANIMLDDDGWAVVTDFGIAKVAQKQALTMTGNTVGTPAYMSPEQCAAKEVTGRSDQYSLGIVGFELLSGRVPFAADSLMGMFMAHMSETPRPLLEVRPDCPPLLARTVERMMAKTAEERWPTLDDVCTVMESLQKPAARASTRVSMAALAREVDERPRPEDFSRPMSPMPLSALPPGTHPAPTPATRAVPRWAWGVAAVPVLAFAVWVATKNGTTTPPTVRPEPRVDSTAPANAGITAAAGAARGTPAIDTGLARDTTSGRNSKASAARDSLTGVKRGSPTVPNPVAGPPVRVASSDTARAQEPVAPAAAPVSPPITTPATSRGDSVTAADPYAGAPTFSEISAGGSTTCGVLTNDAGVVCWGAASLSGARLDGVLFAKVAVGDGHTCGLTPSGEAF
jgi:serine/threonine protein kinase